MQLFSMITIQFNEFINSKIANFIFKHSEKLKFLNIFGEYV